MTVIHSDCFFLTPRGERTAAATEAGRFWCSRCRCGILCQISESHAVAPRAQWLEQWVALLCVGRLVIECCVRECSESTALSAECGWRTERRWTECGWLRRKAIALRRRSEARLSDWWATSSETAVAETVIVRLLLLLLMSTKWHIWRWWTEHGCITVGGRTKAAAAENGSARCGSIAWRWVEWWVAKQRSTWSSATCICVRKRWTTECRLLLRRWENGMACALEHVGRLRGLSRTAAEYRWIGVCLNWRWTKAAARWWCRWTEASIAAHWWCRWTEATIAARWWCRWSKWRGCGGCCCLAKWRCGHRGTTKYRLFWLGHAAEYIGRCRCRGSWGCASRGQHTKSTERRCGRSGWHTAAASEDIRWGCRRCSCRCSRCTTENTARWQCWCWATERWHREKILASCGNSIVIYLHYGQSRNSSCSYHSLSLLVCICWSLWICC